MSASPTPPGARRDEPSAPWANVEFGPPLPMAVYTCTETWNAERIGAAVLYCSDGRWGEAFDEFCHRRLLIPRYDRWAVPGGPICLLPRHSGDGFCRGVWEQLDFLVCAHELRRGGLHAPLRSGA